MAQRVGAVGGRASAPSAAGGPRAGEAGLRVGLDAAEAASVLEAFVRGYVEDAGAEGVLLGLSGGLDSATAAHLCARALGPPRVLAVMLPDAATPSRDVAHALLVCDQLDLERVTADIGPVVAAARAALGFEPSRSVLGNLKARARMLLLYGLANARGRLVCGTGNKSELLTGYFTKHGDGGVDLQPLGDLFKTQVRALAEHYGVPEAIREKVPTAGLWEGQTDEAELGMPYAALDRVLLGLEIQLPSATIARLVGVPAAEVARIEALRARSQHKRRGALVPKLGIRTTGLDWRVAVHERPEGA